MNIIEKIRAEVERQAKSIDTATGDFAEGRRMEQRHILFFLDTLQEQPVDLDDEVVRWIKEHSDVDGTYSGIEFARHFYELGRQSKEQPLCEDFDLESDRFFRKLPLRANTPPIPDEYIDEETFDKIARHFAQWQKEQMMIQWTGNNLKDVIEFTGKSPRFNEWFKSWDDYEDYVRQHGNIFKMFNDDGSHLEVPVGAWIVKTPDKRCVASKFTLKQPESEKIASAYQLGLADKEKQMLKEAVELSVVEMGLNPSPYIVKSLEDKYKEGDKVKLIIVKED